PLSTLSLHDALPIFVSGASRGIGRGCALALAEAGFDVAVNYLTHPDEAADVVAEVERLGRRAFAHRAVVSDRAQVDALVAEALADRKSTRLNSSHVK